MKIIPLEEIFTPEQLNTAKLCLTLDELQEQVVAPNMEQINARTGQENDARYLALALGIALSSQGWPVQRAGEA